MHHIIIPLPQFCYFVKQVKRVLSLCYLLVVIFSYRGELYHSRPNCCHRGRHVLADFGVE